MFCFLLKYCPISYFLAIIFIDPLDTLLYLSISGKEAIQVVTDRDAFPSGSLLHSLAEAEFIVCAGLRASIIIKRKNLPHGAST